jgi:hypothetical protein
MPAFRGQFTSCGTRTPFEQCPAEQLLKLCPVFADAVVDNSCRARRTPSGVIGIVTPKMHSRNIRGHFALEERCRPRRAPADPLERLRPGPSSLPSTQPAEIVKITMSGAELARSFPRPACRLKSISPVTAEKRLDVDPVDRCAPYPREQFGWAHNVSALASTSASPGRRVRRAWRRSPRARARARGNRPRRRLRRG